MSFILDALKKSETDRQRQNGPALFEVRTAPPRSGLPLWAIGLAALLAVNLVIVAWVLLRKPSTPEVAVANPSQAPGAVTPVPPYSPPPAGYSPQQGYQGQQGYPPPQGGYQGQGAQGYAGNPPGPGYSGPQGAPPQGQGYPQQGYPQQGQQQQQGYPGQGQAAYGAQQQQQPYGGPNGSPMGPPGAQQVAGTAPNGPLAQTAGMTAPRAAGESSQTEAGAGDKLNPDDYAPAADPGPVAPFANRVTKGTSAGVPLYRDAALVPGVTLPPLSLDLHVFAAKPQDRFVMINMHKLHEGDLMPEGVRVESITPEGAVLSKDGMRFLLPRD